MKFRISIQNYPISTLIADKEKYVFTSMGVLKKQETLSYVPVGVHGRKYTDCTIISVLMPRDLKQVEIAYYTEVNKLDNLKVVSYQDFKIFESSLLHSRTTKRNFRYGNKEFIRVIYIIEGDNRGL